MRMPAANESPLRASGSRVEPFLSRRLPLSVEAIWAIILSIAFVKWLRGKVLTPVVEGDQMLLQLLG